MIDWVERYAGKTVAVTGASGFIGGHLVRRLVPACQRVIAFARGSATPLMPALGGAQIVLGDIRNRHELEKALHSADVVFHLAGHSGSLTSSLHPHEDLLVNCGGMQNVCETVRPRAEGVRVVFAGSRLQYGRVDNLPVSEDAPKRPLVPYGVHKNFCEQYLEYYARRFGIGYAVARITNPYGSWPNPAHQGYNVINQMIQRAMRGEQIPVYGDGMQLRDYVYIEDVVEALGLLGSCSGNPVVNVGSGIGTPFIAVVRAILELAENGSMSAVPWPKDASDVETGDFVADVRAAAGLGWSPQHSLEQGLRATIAEQRRLT